MLNAVESHDIKIENNIFYNGVKILASMIEGHNNQFMNNALIFVRLRDINTGSFINWASLGYFVTRYGR